MDLPIKFPSETEVILEDVARFRALPPSERVQALVSLLGVETVSSRSHPGAAWVVQYTEEQEVLAQRRTREFLEVPWILIAGSCRKNCSGRSTCLRRRLWPVPSCHAPTGGLAVSMRGRPRLTQDIDFLVDVPQIALPGLLDELVERGFSLEPAVVMNQYVREHITAFSFGRVRIDWLKPVLPFYARALADASPLARSEGHSIRVASPEGLILTKMVSFRSRDQDDIETLLTANRDKRDHPPEGMNWGANGVAGGGDRPAGRAAGVTDGGVESRRAGGLTRLTHPVPR